MKKILVVDDDVSIGNMLEEMLIKEGYTVLRAYSGTEALLLLRGEKPDLVLLDLMLPGLSGEEVLAHLQDIPVIVMSARADVEDKVELLLGGAVDYVTKPFSGKELMARIAVQLRLRENQQGNTNQPNDMCVNCEGRNSNNKISDGIDCGVNEKNVIKVEKEENKNVLNYDLIYLNIAILQCFADGREVHLSRTEFAILKLLMSNPTQIVSRSMILDNICLDTPDCTESSLKVHVSHLRRKLRDATGKDYIEAVWGIGFRLRPNLTNS